MVIGLFCKCIFEVEVVPVGNGVWTSSAMSMATTNEISI